MEKEPIQHIDPFRGSVLERSVLENGRHPSTHPLAKVVLKKADPFEIAQTLNPTTGKLEIDLVVFRSVTNMDWGA